MKSKNHPDAELLANCVLLEQSEVARLLRISTRTLQRLCANRQVPTPVYIGRFPRWRQNELTAWLDNRCPAIEQSLDEELDH